MGNLIIVSNQDIVGKLKMSDGVLNVRDIDSYHQHFKDQAVNFSRGPVQNRTCNDKCCFVLFILMTVAFVGIGAYFIQAGKVSQLSKDIFQGNNHLATTTDQQFGIQNLKPAIPVVISMLALAVITAVIFLVLLIKFPQCMFYAMLAISAVLMVVLIIVMLIAGIYVVAIGLTLMLLLFACVLFCNKDKIRIGIVLLNTAASFLTQKKTVFLTPFFILLFVVVFQAFWIASMVGIYRYQAEQTGSSQQETASETASAHSMLMGLWSFFHIFYSIFFNYCLVFIIATACGMWYYNIQANYLFTACYRIIRYHLGSLTFATILIAIVTMVRRAVQDEARESQGACAICLCLLACVISIIEDLLQILNHNSIIVMSVTGESYFNSAKSTISLIFNNFALFSVVDLISSVTQLTGILLICGLPSFVGYFLLKQTSENPDDTTYLVAGMVIIVMISILIGIIFLGVLSQALSCVFIFYCLDQKFKDFGYQVTDNIPHKMRELFQGLDSGEYAKGGESRQDYNQNNQRGYHNNNQQGYPNNNQQGYQNNNQQGYPNNNQQGYQNNNQGGWGNNHQGGYQNNPYQSNQGQR